MRGATGFEDREGHRTLTTPRGEALSRNGPARSASFCYRNKNSRIRRQRIVTRDRVRVFTRPG